jgi:hypothetical protein
MSQTQRVASRPHERRQHQRVKLVLLGRFMLEDQREFPCQSIDVSPGGIALRAPIRGEVGERVVAYIDQVGRLEGTIARLIDNGFAMSYAVSRHKQERLANQLTWLANRDVLGLSEDRRHERVVPRQTRVPLKTDDGHETIARIIDVSRSGAAITAPFNPPIGSHVVVGRSAATVTRHFSGGFSVEFKSPLIVPILDEDVRI